MLSSDYGFVEERFEIVDLVADSADLRCFKAREKASGRRVLLQYLKAPFPRAADLAKLHNHYQFSRQTSADWTVVASELWQEQGRSVLVLEDPGGASLRQYVQRGSSPRASASKHAVYLDAFHLALKIAQGLQYLESLGICHGDLNPDSVWVDAGAAKVRLADFFYARGAGVAPITPWRAGADTRERAYLAPEVDSSSAFGTSPQSDFYALGRLLYGLLDGGVWPCDARREGVLAAPMGFPPAFVDAVDLAAAGGGVLSSAMDKLLNADPAKRYQSADELVQGLRSCIAWLDSGPGQSCEAPTYQTLQRDFQVSEQLVGRGEELQCLEASRAAAARASIQVVKITGRAGMGKTALAQHFLRDCAARGCLVSEGKYGQYRRDEPLSAILDALGGLMLQILAEPPPVQQRWRERLGAALGEQAAVLTRLLPALEQLIGVQPELPPIAGELAARRQSQALRDFLGALHQHGHPLVLYLDDLQWADRSSLRLLRDLSAQGTGLRVLLLLAYRNDRSVALLPGRHDFLRLASDNPDTVELELEPLRQDEMAQIVSATLGCSVAKAQPLTQLVAQKTAGDPFYLRQFLQAMHGDGIIEFEEVDRCWVCDLSAARRASLTEHVVEFMGARLRELDAETLEILQVMSCLGGALDVRTLANSMDRSRLDVARMVWGALESGLVVLERDVYKFQASANDDEPLDEFSVLYEERLEYSLLHDRVRQAAYSLIPAAERGRWHAALGRRLLAHYERGGDDRSLFDILDKLGHGLEYVEEPAECEAMSALCLEAGVKARAYIAYDESLSYLQRGIAVLGRSGVDCSREHRIGIHLEAANSALYASRFNTAFELLDEVEEALEAPLEILQHAFIGVQLRCLVNKLDEALAQGYRSLERFQRHRISDAQMQVLCSQDYPGPVDVCAKRAAMEDEAALLLLLSMTPAAFYTTSAAYQELVLFQLQYCLDWGACSNTSIAICNYGTVFLGRGDYPRALALSGPIATVEQCFPDDEALRRKHVLMNAFYSHWSKPLSEVAAYGVHSADECIALGDYMFATYAAIFYAEKHVFCCQDLADYERQVGTYAQFTGQALHQVPHYQLSVWHQFALNLSQGSLEPTELEGEAFSERQSLPLLESNKNEMILFYLYFCKALLALHFDRPVAASRNMRKAKQTLQSCSAAYCGNLLALYELILAFDQDAPDSALAQLREFRAREQVQRPERELNLGHFEAFLTAQACAAEGDVERAVEGFGRAVDGALQRGMVHDALFFKERLARYYAACGMAAQASTLFAQCYHDYNRWGGRAKADHLRRHFSEHMPADLSL